MKVLLDTNIVIHREAGTVVEEEIGVLFHWLDRLNCEKCVHPLTVSEIEKHKDPRVVRTFGIKLKSYFALKTLAADSKEIVDLRKTDQNENDENDTSILKEVFAKRVDSLITEDRRIHAKAKLLGIADRVFTIDDFLEKVTTENPALADYKVLAVKKEYFGAIDLMDSFFNEFKSNYRGFSEWFNKKSDEIAYICRSETGKILAFLYIKTEDEKESYHDIEPRFTAKRRLKIGTFKVEMNGFKLGERFLKIIFDNALQQRVSEIYVTIFNKDADHERLMEMLLDWGFKKHGVKNTSSGKEQVLVRDFTPRINPGHPMATYPYISGRQRKFIVSIYPKYHTELLPDSILWTESPADFIDNRPNRNAIRKVFISRSLRSDMKTGDIVIFYRTADGGSGRHTSVATTLGIIERVVTPIEKLDDFIMLCRKRSVFSDTQLKEHWDYNPRSRPFVVNFLYVHSFPKRPNLEALQLHGIISTAPRGFDEISNKAFATLLKISNADERIIVD